MSSPGLVVIGSGGFGREAARAALDGGYSGEVLGFLDDDPALTGATVAGLPVLGPIAAVADLPDAQVIVATGRPDNYTSRASIVGRLGLPRNGTARWCIPEQHWPQTPRSDLGRWCSPGWWRPPGSGSVSTSR